jgi:hypothetical protein
MSSYYDLLFWLRSFTEIIILGEHQCTCTKILSPLVLLQELFLELACLVVRPAAATATAMVSGHWPAVAHSLQQQEGRSKDLLKSYTICFHALQRSADGSSSALHADAGRRPTGARNARTDRCRPVRAIFPPIWRYRLLHGWRLRWHLGLQPHRWLLAGRCHNFHTTVRSGGGGRSALCTQPSAALHLPSILAAAESSSPGETWRLPWHDSFQFFSSYPCRRQFHLAAAWLFSKFPVRWSWSPDFLTFVWLLTWSHHFVYTMYTDTLPLWAVGCGLWLPSSAKNAKMLPYEFPRMYPRHKCTSRSVCFLPHMTHVVACLTATCLDWFPGTVANLDNSVLHLCSSSGRPWNDEVLVLMISTEESSTLPGEKSRGGLKSHSY